MRKQFCGACLRVTDDYAEFTHHGLNFVRCHDVAGCAAGVAVLDAPRVAREKREAALKAAVYAAALAARVKAARAAAATPAAYSVVGYV